MSGMGRREFVALLGGAAATWPLVAGAQQLERMRRIGVLTGDAEDDPGVKARVAASAGDPEACDAAYLYETASSKVRRGPISTQDFIIR
jgi:hypothetical protein